MSPYIETLRELAEELADKVGIYGSHDEEEAVPCRICWTDDLRDRMLRAVENERKLLPLGPGGGS